MKGKGHVDTPKAAPKASRSKGSNSARTTANVRRRRSKHLKKYPNDFQAAIDIKDARRWKEAQP